MRKPITEEMLETMELMWRQDARVSEIAQRLGVTDRVVYRLSSVHRSRFPSRRVGNWRSRLGAAPSPSINVYQWRHPEGAIINLPIVKGYVGEQAHG